MFEEASADLNSSPSCIVSKVDAGKTNIFYVAEPVSRKIRISCFTSGCFFLFLIHQFSNVINVVNARNDR